MENPPLLTRIVEWLRAGYPDGVPQADYIPLVALLRRQLTEDEVKEVARVLTDDATADDEPITSVDAAVEITKHTLDMPHPDDVARVRRHLELSGWPFDDDTAVP